MSCKRHELQVLFAREAVAHCLHRMHEQEHITYLHLQNVHMQRGW